ncbi:hypothetical protein RAAC3_TM7C00001G0055 [Candidatus Saccharibacteria bacterium RAAC3_TM7_1]|nr:hypothetical protein RAAC3_TM7C00001G0055 [Candidatus Saccharibacteria bacterium RAAC3_TM7_1]HCZ28340.1 prepilin-type N-terminal cleavage/methylation domain-containing protein [Candidatus Saccharibacteria bacterium]
MTRLSRGFTIVELLIVIVVIAILASITIVAYNGTQNRAKDSQLDSAIFHLKGSLEIYLAEKGVYPPACGADNAGCNVSNLATYLVPSYLDTMPSTPTTLNYVRGSGTEPSYAILIDYLSKPNCKTGVNVNTGWWGTGVPVC